MRRNEAAQTTVTTTCKGCGCPVDVPADAVGVAYCTTSCARRKLGGLHFAVASVLVVAALLVTAGTAAAAPDDDLWACTDEERTQMGVPAGQSCYLTGEQLDAAGWVEMDDGGEFWCSVDPDAPQWVRDSRKGPC